MITQPPSAFVKCPKSLLGRSKAEVGLPDWRVGFALKNGHAATAAACRFCAISGLMRRSKRSAYSITSSARAISEAGSSRPRAFVVFRLITRSYLVGA